MKTTEEYFSEMNLVQQNYSTLSELDSTSAMSVWGLMKKMFAFLASQLSIMLDEHETIINTQILQQQVGTADWYLAQIRAFQYGDNISVINNKIGYETVDEAKQIVSEAVLEVVDNILMFKVATVLNNERVKLSDEQVAALDYYISKVKFLGTRVKITSLDADTLYLALSVKVNRLLVANDGSLIGSSSIFPIVNAIKDYVENRPFNSVFSNRDIQDFLIGLPWVESVNSIMITYSSTGVVSTKDYYTPVSGYVKMDLNSKIEYVY